jgi:Fe-S-cluster containining protein
MNTTASVKLSNYRAFIKSVDALTVKLTERYQAHLLCRAGCSGCCHHHLSVFPVEAASVQSAIASLTDEVQQRLHIQAKTVMEKETNGEMASCPLLLENCCSIYESRPLICRTQGLPLLYETDKGAQEVDFCPLNFTTEEALNDLEEQHLVPLDALNLQLAKINWQYCRESGLNSEKTATRIPVAEIIHKQFIT